MNNDITTAEVSPSEEADWLQCLLNSLMAAHRPEDTKRFGVGRYTLDEVSLLLALSLSETGAFSSQLRDHMWAAVERSELRLRDEVTGLFVGEKHQRNGWGVVTRQDVNAWLEVNEVGYRWDDPSASTCGSETPETNRTAEAESAPAAMLAPEPTAPAEPVHAADTSSKPAKEHEPPPLKTPEIADAFDGLDGNTATQWRQRLSDVNNHSWLLPARAVKATAPKSATWYPLVLATLLQKRGESSDSLNRAFSSAPKLKPWLHLWREHMRERNVFGQ